MKFRYLAGLLAALVVGPALADATATVEEIYSGYGDNQVLTGHKVTVTITPNAADVGRPGAYYIGVMRNGNDLAFYQNGTWFPPSTDGKSNVYQPAEFFQAVPGGSRSYVVLNNQLICSLVGPGNNAVVYAGYGVLTPQYEYLVQNYHATANPKVPADHIRNTYVRMDMNNSKKYWNVLNWNCPSDNGGGS